MCKNALNFFIFIFFEYIKKYFIIILLHLLIFKPFCNFIYMIRKVVWICFIYFFFEYEKLERKYLI